MNRMQRLSRALHRFASFLFALALILLVFSPGLLLLDSAILESANDFVRRFGMDGLQFSLVHMGWKLRVFIFLPLVAMGATAVLSLGALIRLLHQFEAGEAFSMESVRLVRFLGWVQVASAPLSLLVLLGMAGMAKTLTAKAVNPWANVADSVTGNLFFGGVVLLAAYALEEGWRLKTEQELVI